MANTTNFNWETPDDTDLVKDGAAAIRTLGSAIDTSLVDLKGGTTGQVLTKASNTDLDYSWTSVDPLTILDAKGDLISATAADTPARLAVGTNGQYLTANSSTSTGLEWITPPSSGGMTLIQETVANANSSISFSSISGSYKQLLLSWDGITHSATGSVFSLRFNNDSGANYDAIYFRSLNSDVNAQSNGAVTYAGENTFAWNANGTSKYMYGRGSMLIDNYASTSKLKMYCGNWNFYNNLAAERNFYITNGSWNSTSAITSLDIVRTSGTATISNATNTSIRLYGIS